MLTFSHCVERSGSRVAGVGMKEDTAFLKRQLGSSFQNHKYAERLISIQTLSNARHYPEAYTGMRNG